MPAFETPEGTIKTKDLLFMWLRPYRHHRTGPGGQYGARIAAISGHAIGSVETILNRYLACTLALARTATKKRLVWLNAEIENGT